MDFISREAWGAKPPRYPVTMVTRKDLFIVHHSGSPGWWPTADKEIAAMQFWQLYHQKIGGADIYYGAVIFPSGRVYEGRYGGWLANNGGAYGCCNRGFGACLAGDFTDEFPTLEALDSLIHLGLAAKGVLNIAPDRYWGHRDCCSYNTKNCGNECPGQMLYNWLPALKETMKNGNEINEKEGETMLPCPVQTNHVFPDIWQGHFATYYLHCKNESDKDNTFRVLVTEGSSVNTTPIETLEAGPFELVSMDLKLALSDRYAGKSVCVTVQSDELSAVYVREA